MLSYKKKRKLENLSNVDRSNIYVPFWLVLRMIKIEAVIRSTKFHLVQHALADIGILTFSAYDIKLAGLHRGHSTVGGRPGSFKASDLIAKTNIVVLCHDREKEGIIKAIVDAAKTGQRGDGLISVYPIGSLTKIRNGATDEQALR